MPRAHTVQTRHGLVSKGHAQQAVATCDHYCVTSEAQADWFRGRGLLPRIDFWPIGYLQLDPLLRGEVAPADVHRQSGRPVVLFAPTIGQTVSALGMLGEDPVAALRPDDDAFTLVIKPHPELEMRHPAWMERLRRAATAHRNTLLVANAAVSIDPWLVAADLLVTDISSVMFFFVALDRPLVLLSSPLRHTSGERLDPEGPEWQWRAIGEEVEDAAGAPAAIARALARPGARAEARRACRETIFGSLTDGRTGERLARRIADLVPRA
jgi:CDP-glycerol glycerophosphotransferase (TagB/SpsB family)